LQQAVRDFRISITRKEEQLFTAQLAAHMQILSKAPAGLLKEGSAPISPSKTAPAPNPQKIWQ
jgi:hypothetical protein